MFKLQMSVTGLTAARMSLRDTQRLLKADLGFPLKMRRGKLHKKAKCRCFRLVYSSTPVLISTSMTSRSFHHSHQPRPLKIIASRPVQLDSIPFVRPFTLNQTASILSDYH
jgi:hypothetical protein